MTTTDPPMFCPSCVFGSANHAPWCEVGQIWNGLRTSISNTNKESHKRILRMLRKTKHSRNQNYE